MFCVVCYLFVCVLVYDVWCDGGELCWELYFVCFFVDEGWFYVDVGMCFVECFDC